MSPPLKDDKERQQEKSNKETKFGVQEEGGKCQDPAFHQEPKVKEYKATLFGEAGLGEFLQRIYFTLYFMFGTGREIDKQIIKIRQFLKGKLPHRTTVSFQGTSSDGNDKYVFTVPLCGKGCVKFDVKVDDEICSTRFDPDKILVPIAAIEEKSKNCLVDGTHVHGMRLREADLPASISFSLLCKQDNMRTATDFTVVILTTDEGGKVITTGNHSVEKQFPACFYNTDAVLQNDNDDKNDCTAGIMYSENQHSLVPSNDKKILENNHDEICRKIKNLLPLVEWCVTNGLLHKRFLKSPYDSLTEERKGEILRHLYEAENILPKFIEALEASQNEELVEFLRQCMASKGDQNYSLE